MMWLLLQMQCPVIVPFICQGSGLPLSGSGSWSGSMCKAHIALQELQAVAMMLCTIAFQLLSKVIALHLDNCTAKVYVIKVVQYLLFFPGRPVRY